MSLSFMAQQQETSLPCIPEGTAVSCASMSVWKPFPQASSWHEATRHQLLENGGPAVSFGILESKKWSRAVDSWFLPCLPALDPSREVAHREGP